MSLILIMTCFMACGSQNVPETSASSGSTLAPETETQAPATDTQAPSTETQTPSSDTEAPSADTEPVTQDTAEPDTQEPESKEIPEDVVFTLDNIRDYVIGLDTPVTLADGTERQAINFDNAATTPSLRPVANQIMSELEMYGSIGRGSSQKSDHSTEMVYQVREKVLDFVGADNNYQCAFCNNTTDGLNKLASALVESEDDIILATRIEHHSNDLPWRERCKVVYAEVDEQGRVIYEDIERLLEEYDVKYVTVTAASNVTGYVTDVHRIAKMAHAHGAKIIVDGAQIVAHREFRMTTGDPAENIDFFVFSAHKMYSPYGGGAIIGPWDIMDAHMPEFYGGGTITLVGDDWQLYNGYPYNYEAGSPNYAGIIGLGKAIDILREIGFDAIQEHEQVLMKKLIDGLKEQPDIILYGDCDNIEDRVGVITFNYTTANTTRIAAHLSDMGGVATRRGAFCAHPYVWRLMGISDHDVVGFENCTDAETPGMVRISLGIYNTEEEVEEFLRVLPLAVEKAAEDSQIQGLIPQF